MSNQIPADTQDHSMDYGPNSNEQGISDVPAEPDEQEISDVPAEPVPSAVPAATQKQGFGDPEAGKEEWRKPVEDDPALTPVQNARKRPWASGRGGANQLMRGFGRK
jgi:hypothetical protein